jgi:hypothetical protein
MNGTNELATNENDDLFEGWFEQGEVPGALEAAPYDEPTNRRSRVGMVIAAVSAAVLTLVVVVAFAGHV